MFAPLNDWGIMKNALFLFLYICCLLGLPYGLGSVPAWADVFTLRNGDVIEGQIFRETEKTYMVLVKHLDGQKMVTLKKRDVVSRDETIEENELLVGLIDIKSESFSDPKMVALALVDCLERSLKQGDDLTFVVFDDLSLDSEGALLFSSSIARAVESGAKERLVCVLGRCSGPSSSVASCFSKVISLPHARLTGPAGNVFTHEQCLKMREHVEVCHPPNAELVEAFMRARPAFHVPGSGWQSSGGTIGIEFPVRNGRFSLTRDELLNTKTSSMSCDSISKVAVCLGHTKTSVRSVRPKAQRAKPSQTPTGLAALIPRRIADFNKGLAKAKEGIEILRRTSSGQWRGWSSSYWSVNIKKYWERDHDRAIIPPSIKKVSRKAQGLIKSGLKTAIDSAQFLEKQAKHQNDPRLLEAAGRIKIMIALEGAVESEIQQGFESRCDVVLAITPLGIR